MSRSGNVYWDPITMLAATLRTTEAQAMISTLDVRLREDFRKLHRAGAVNIPLEELSRRVHELPPPTNPVAIYDAVETRARWARSRLRARGRRVAAVYHGLDWLQAGHCGVGPSRRRLWQPHALLVEAVTHARRLGWRMEARRALDIACGTGRDAVFLAACGFRTEAWDVLPDAIARCDELSANHGVSVETHCRDVEADLRIAASRYDLVSCFNYLHRPLMRSLVDSVRPGGLVAYETFFRPQRALYGRPRRDAHLLEPGELVHWFKDWHLLSFREGLLAPQRFAAAIIAKKPEDPR